MAPVSAGILLFRRRGPTVEVFLVHPGGPLWSKRDHAAWSIPKGLAEPDEDLLDAARREFAEETGHPVSGRFIPLGHVKTSGGKTIHAWAVEGDMDAEEVRSNTFTMQWPPKSGSYREFPEVDKAAWFPLTQAKEKMNKGQVTLLGELERLLQEPDRNGRR